MVGRLSKTVVSMKEYLRTVYEWQRFGAIVVRHDE